MPKASSNPCRVSIVHWAPRFAEVQSPARPECWTVIVLASAPVMSIAVPAMASAYDAATLNVVGDVTIAQYQTGSKSGPDVTPVTVPRLSRWIGRPVTRLWLPNVAENESAATLELYVKRLRNPVAPTVFVPVKSIAVPVDAPLALPATRKVVAVTK